MKRKWKGIGYETNLVSDNREGWTALGLHASEPGGQVLVARVVFWDAEGQFALEMHRAELPLELVEELITEARSKIKIR